MSEPRTIHEYLEACADAISALVDAAEAGEVWFDVEVHQDQRYALRGQTGIRGATGQGTINLAMAGERGGDWADGDPGFTGFGLNAEVYLPAKTAAEWTAADKRLAVLAADLREVLETIPGTGGVAEWAVDYADIEMSGGTYKAADVSWRSSEG